MTATAPQDTAAPHLREDLLTPRFYTTEIAKAARTDLEAQRPALPAPAQTLADQRLGG